MTRLTRTFPLALTLALGLGVLSCAVPPAPVMERQANLGSARLGSMSLVVVPRVVEHPAIQAVVAAPTAASISRLDVFPMVETSPGVFQPFKADGTPTVLGDAEALVVSQNVPSLKLDRGITLTGLARNTKYRVLARAYDAQGKLLSADAGSTVDVTVGVDDAPTSTALPVQLADVPFAAKTTISLVNDALADYATAVTTLVTVSGGVETPVPGNTQTLTKAQMPMLLALDGLMANTTYRLNASLRDASNAQMATASVEIAVTNDDMPAGKTLTLRAGLLSIFAGPYPSNPFGLVDGTGTAARFTNPFGLVLDASGNVYVADSNNHAIRQITPAGVVTTVAGSYPTKTNGYTNGTGTAARFYQPSGIARDASGNLFVADYGNHAIRKITPAGVVTTFAGGEPSNFGLVDGTGTAARFKQPIGIVIDTSGNLFVTEYGNHAIRKITPAGVVSTFAGSTVGDDGFQNGTGTAARFYQPSGIAIDGSNNLYVADRLNYAIRKITPGGVVTTLAGGTSGFADGTGTAAQFKQPYGVATDASGNVYVADTNNNAIRKISSAGVVTTILGSYPTATPGFVDGTGTAARFRIPMGIAVDAAGTLYVADSGNHAIRRFK